MAKNITDNGIGFDTDHHKKGKGLENLKRSASEHRATLVFQSSKTTGTQITLQMPFN